MRRMTAAAKRPEPNTTSPTLPGKSPPRHYDGQRSAHGIVSRASAPGCVREPPTWAYHWPKPRAFEPAGSDLRQIGRAAPRTFDASPAAPAGGPNDNDPNGGVGTIAWHSRVRRHARHDPRRRMDPRRAVPHQPSVCGTMPRTTTRRSGVNVRREMIWLNYVMGVRESRRLLGDYVLTENDYIRQTVHADTVAYSGWGMDVHHPEGFWVRGNDCMHYYRDRKVSIPLRSLYFRNIANLLMAGRATRPRTWEWAARGSCGPAAKWGRRQAAAAALATRVRRTPRDVGREHIGELQQMLLKDGCYLIGVPNRDPADLALKARATASSIAPPAEASIRRPAAGQSHKLDRDRAVMFIAHARSGSNRSPCTCKTTPASQSASRLRCARPIAPTTFRPRPTWRPPAQTCRPGAAAGSTSH